VGVLRGFLGLLLCAVPLACGGEERASFGRHPASQFLIEHDRFLPATDPEVLPAKEADFLQRFDQVFGVVVEGRARAYPITMIAYHHVVNDTIGRTPVAVTY
jgi:hypothetical protein